MPGEANEWISPYRDGTRVKVVVQPRSSRNEFAGMQGGALKIRLTAPPVGGAGNRALIAFLSKAWGIPKKHFLLLRGEKSRQKTLYIARPVDEVTRWVTTCLSG